MGISLYIIASSTKVRLFYPAKQILRFTVPQPATRTIKVTIVTAEIINSPREKPFMAAVFLFFN